MIEAKYIIPPVPSYRVHGIRAIQDEDYVSASLVVNPMVEAVLESIDYVYQLASGLIARMELTIPAEGWQEDPGGGVVLDLPVEWVTETMTPIVTLSAAALETAGNCELKGTCETLSGAVRFRAGSAPEGDMASELLLILPRGGPGAGIPAVSVAADEDVAEMLDSVLGGSRQGPGGGL